MLAYRTGDLGLLLLWPFLGRSAFAVRGCLAFLTADHDAHELVANLGNIGRGCGRSVGALSIGDSGVLECGW